MISLKTLKVVGHVSEFVLSWKLTIGCFCMCSSYMELERTGYVNTGVTKPASRIWAVFKLHCVSFSLCELHNKLSNHRVTQESSTDFCRKDTFSLRKEQVGLKEVEPKGIKGIRISLVLFFNSLVLVYSIHLCICPQSHPCLFTLTSLSGNHVLAKQWWGGSRRVVRIQQRVLMKACLLEGPTAREMVGKWC